MHMAQEQTSSQNMDSTDNDALTGEKISKLMFFSARERAEFNKSSNLIGS